MLIRVRIGNAVVVVDLTNSCATLVGNIALSVNSVNLLHSDAVLGYSNLSAINGGNLLACCIIHGSLCTVVSDSIVLTIDCNRSGILVDSICGVSSDLTGNIAGCNLQGCGVSSAADGGLAIKCASLNLQVNAVYIDSAVCAGVEGTSNSAAVGQCASRISILGVGDGGVSSYLTVVVNDGAVSHCTAVQGNSAVEVGISDLVQFVVQLIELELDSVTVGGVVVCTVSRLGSQLLHSLKDGVCFLSSALIGLDHGDTILSVSLSLAKTADLRSHLLRNSKTCSVVASAVDSVTRRKLLRRLLQTRYVCVQLVVRVESV